MVVIEDNYKLSLIRGGNMDIAEYINKLTSEQFEAICVELLRAIKPNVYRIVGTRYVKDGGKDIVGTVAEVPYEIWAECKKHTRSLGLEEISKNVVLVISQDINELFFFSVSDISRNAQKHISTVATKHGFKVAFYYGESLMTELERLPRFKKAPKQAYENDGLTVTDYITAYEHADRYEKTDTVVLHRDNFFYIDLFLSNRSEYDFSDICFTWKRSEHINLVVKAVDSSIKLSAFNDRFVQIKGEVLNSKSVQRIPRINISYKVKNEYKTLNVDCGFVDPTQLLYFPLIGEKPQGFLTTKITPVLTDKSGYDTYIIDIKGESGTGKSRLLKEIINLAAQYKKRIILFDAKKYNDYNIVKELICTLLYIPYNKGSIEFSSKNIQNILIKYNADSVYAEAIYSFVFENNVNTDTVYFVKQALLYFLMHPLFDEKYILLFDNVQMLSHDMIDMLVFLIDNLTQSSSSCIIALSTNTELVPDWNTEKISALFRFLDDTADEHHMEYECHELAYNDAASLYEHALNTDNNILIDRLIKKSGCRPFDIIMLIKYMQEQQIITWQSMSTWYITSFDKLEQLVTAIPQKSKKLIKDRITLQKTCNSHEYWRTFKTVIKALTYFQGFVPLDFLEYINIDDDILDDINNSLFIKYDEYMPIITFFHDNLYRYFSAQRSYTVDVALAKKINSWLLQNEDTELANRNSILYKTYIDTSRFGMAKQYGLKTVMQSYNNRNYHECYKLGIQILENKHIELSEQEEFDILHTVSDSAKERTDHQRGAEIFYKAYNFLNSHKSNISITQADYNKFMHDCINSQINARYPEKALEILHDFEKSDTVDDHHMFIIFNRYCVAYLAVGDLNKAREYITKAVSVAEKMGNAYLKSIAYSDMAYLHFNGDEDTENVISYFEKAYTENDCTDDLNRNTELFQQMALSLCLKNDTANAIEMINKSIETGEQIKNSFLIIKAYTLKSIIYYYDGQYDKAVKMIDKALILCEASKSIVGKIKLYTNLAAISIDRNNFKQAREYIDIAFTLFKTADISSLKHKPLFYNYISVYKNQLSRKELFKKISEYSNEQILQYLDDAYACDIFSDNAYGVIKPDKGIFNF